MSPSTQVVRHGGRPVAITLGTEHVVVFDHVAAEELSEVKAMCLYALEVAAGDRPGPYDDETALSFAWSATRAPRSK